MPFSATVVAYHQGAHLETKKVGHHWVWYSWWKLYYEIIPSFKLPSFLYDPTITKTKKEKSENEEEKL